MRVSVEQVHSFKKIEKVWDKLYVSNRNLTYYQSADYMGALWDNLASYKLILRCNPEFYVFSKDGAAVFILPLFKRWLKNEYVLYGRKAGVGYLDAIYAEDIANDDITECFEKLRGEIKGATLRLEHVRDNTSFGKWLLENGCKVSEEGCTEIPLPGRYEDYYGSLSKHMKQNIRTAYNRLKTDEGEFEFKVYDYNEMPNELYEQLQEMYIDRQINKYGKSRLYKHFVRYVDLGTKIQRDKRIREKAFVLYINGWIAAYYDAIYSDDCKTVIVPRLAIAEGFDRYSPGVMVVNESIKVLTEEGIKCIDLTHGTEPYKLSMGGCSRRCIEGEIHL